MEIGPREIHNKEFHDAWRGYDQEEVDDFLDRVAESIDRIVRENELLTKRVRELEQTLSMSREAEEMLKKTLVSAQQAAEEAIGKARAKADQLIAEAEERARRSSEEARQRLAATEQDIQRKSDDAMRDFTDKKRALDSDIEKLRQFEGETKQKLKAFFEQQLRALDSLADRPPATRPVEAVQGARPVARAAHPQPSEHPHPTPAPQPVKPVTASAESQQAPDPDERAQSLFQRTRELFTREG